MNDFFCRTFEPADFMAKLEALTNFIYKANFVHELREWVSGHCLAVGHTDIHKL